MKKILGLVLMVLVVSTVFAGGGKEGSDTFELKFAHIADESNSWHKAAMKFKEIVEAKSEGRIEVKLYPNNQLGSEVEVIQSIQTGTADMTITADTLQKWAPALGVMGAAYMIDDSAHLERVVEGKVGETIESEILSKTGLKPIAWFERGPRFLTSNKPIPTPDDLSDVVIRVPDVPMYVAVWDALGAKPTPMAFNEVFTSLQQGVIDAQENPLALIKSGGFYEVQDYVNKTEHVRGWIYVVIGDKKFNSMPADLQQIVLDAAQEMQTYERELMRADEKQLQAFLEENGMTFVDVDQDKFSAKVQSAVIEKLTAEQKELYDIARSLK